MTLTRRELVHTLGATASLGWIEGPAADGSVAQATADRIVYMGGDGIGLSPRGYTSLLDDLTRKLEVREDNYLLGGEVERFEQHCAALLGKEAAVFMPSARSPTNWRSVRWQATDGA